MAGYLEKKSKYQFSSFYLFLEQGAAEVCPNVVAQREALLKAAVPSQNAQRILRKRRRQPHPNHDQAAHRSK